MTMLSPEEQSRAQSPSKENLTDEQIARSVSVDNDEDSITSRTTMMDAESFLESYEEMLQHQKEELSATMRHVEPLLEILEAKRALLHDLDDTEEEEDPVSPFAREFTYKELRSALKEIERDPSLRFMVSDLQWNTVLQLLSETCLDMGESELISWAEIVMCYRTCIIGMQTLSQTPRQDELRARVRERSMQMLHSFRPSSIASRKEPRKQATVPRERSSGGNFIHWIDPLFLVGILVLCFSIAFSELLASSGNSEPVHASLSLPKIPGPHVQPFSVEILRIPGPVISPFAADSLKIPGPAMPPFLTENDTTKDPSFCPEEDVKSKASAPASIQRSTSRRSSTPGKKDRELLDGPLPVLSRSKSNVSLLGNSQPTRISSPRGNLITKKGVSIAAIAGGTAAAGYLGPMATTAVASLGATLPGLAAIGGTVLVATLLAHGVRDLLANLFHNKR